MTMMNDFGASLRPTGGRFFSSCGWPRKQKKSKREKRREKKEREEERKKERERDLRAMADPTKLPRAATGGFFPHVAGLANKKSKKEKRRERRERRKRGRETSEPSAV